MIDRFAENLPTDDEARRFEQDGYLVVEDALGADQLAGLTALAEELRSAWSEPPADRPRSWLRRGAGGSAGRPDVAGFRPMPLAGSNVEFQAALRDPRVLALADHEVLLPKVAGLLGWNIALYLGALMLSPPGAPDADVAGQVAVGWHQDSSRVNGDVEGEPRPRLSVKVAYFLSDLTEAGRANMYIVPGSHRSNTLPADAARSGIPLRVRAGTAVLFDRRLWHSSSPNLSDLTRQVVFLGYGYRWLRPHDDMDLEPLWTSADPLRRQLLGWAPDATSRYAPEDEDVPLKALLERSREAATAAS